MVRGAIVLPHGTGKRRSGPGVRQGRQGKGGAEAGADFVGGDDLAKKIQEGWLEFDRVIATPGHDERRRSAGPGARPARADAEPEARDRDPGRRSGGREQKAGKVEYRVDKNGIVHCAIGKKSFEPSEAARERGALIDAILKAKPASSKGIYIKKVVLISTRWARGCGSIRAGALARAQAAA